MAEYLYIAQTHGGAIEKGRIKGTDPNDARQTLASRGRRLISIQQATGLTAGLPVRAWAFHGHRYRMLRARDKELLLQQLAVMLESGLELTASLWELNRHSPQRRQQQLCAEIAEAIQQGKSLATALDETRTFPPVVVQLARVGEQTGELAVALQRAAQFMQGRRQAINDVLAALAYPLLVAAAAGAVAVYLVGWAVPKLASFLHAMGRKLPAMTQTLMDVSAAVQLYGIQTAIATITILCGLLLLYAWRPGRYRIDRRLLRVPLMGPLLAMAETHQLASALSLMLRSGVVLHEALATAASLHQNRYLAARVAQACDQLRRGKDLASALDGAGFAPMLPSMVAVGERTGDLPQALEHVAKFYAGQVDAALKRFSRLVEPAIIVVVGGLVGYVYIAFFMALMSAGGNFR